MAEPQKAHGPDAGKPTIVIDLGRKKRKAVKRLRRGEGRLMNDVTDAIEELKGTGRIGPEVQPVVVVVREKRKKSSFPW